ncbi:serine protease inhibitor [Marasmius fiardii PR-910]|nr:serine protease inhibitor [Marasmius fiardii PR-910]
MSLETGFYVIHNEGTVIGRRLGESFSSSPKAIIKHRKETLNRQGVWKVEKVGPDVYTLSTQGAYTSKIEGRVYAILLLEPPPEKWIIEPVPQHGNNKYIILSETRQKGWVAPYEDTEPVNVRSLVSTCSPPSFYTPDEVFEITPA